MRQPQNAKRGRGRGRRGNSSGQPHVPNRNTSYESNGPDVKLRGNAQQLFEKYTALAQDAATAGERISAEAYSQFADHYFRLHQAAVGAAETRRQTEAASEQSASEQPVSEQPVSEQPVSEQSGQPSAAAEQSDGGASDSGAVSNPASAEKAAGAKKPAGAKKAGGKAGAEVVTLSPADLSEAVQQEQDTASA